MYEYLSNINGNPVPGLNVTDFVFFTADYEITVLNPITHYQKFTISIYFKLVKSLQASFKHFLFGIF